MTILPTPLNRGSIRTALSAAFFALVVLCCCSTSLFAQTLTSDLPDYYPGQLATLTGTGFQPGEAVTLLVVHDLIPGDNETSPAHQPWSVVADASGNFVATWQVPADQDELGATLYATADGQVSGIHAAVTFTDNISANLDQVRNGPKASPTDPGQWVNGNVNATQAHMVEGYSVPYRMVMNGLTAGQTYTLEIEWDTRHSGENALDYITYYDRLQPHLTQFGHNAEQINPLLNLPGTFSAPSYYDLSSYVPASVSVNGILQPQTSFNNLPSSEKKLTIWNGTITNFQYLCQQPLVDDITSTRARITFTASAASTVIAWGGHIAKSSDWDGHSAGAVSGSPYHMRLKGFCAGSSFNSNLCSANANVDYCNSGGNQDRALAAAAVEKPHCGILGDTITCTNSTLNFCSQFGGTGFGFNWFVVDTAPNTAGATLIPPTTDSCVNGNYLHDGRFRLGLTLTLNGESATCSAPVIINALNINIVTSNGDPIICQGGSTVITADPGVSGNPGDFTYHWSGPAGVVIADSTSPSITVVQAGQYCVTITNTLTGCSKDTCLFLTTVIPLCDINGDSILCLGGSVKIYEAANGGFGTGYSWTPSQGIVSGNGTDSIIVAPTVSTTYSVSFTDANGCPSNCSYPVTVNPLPECSISGPAAICQGTSAQYCAAAGMSSYLWSNNATTQCITVSSAGTYSVTITNANGCTSSCSKTLAINDLPSCAINGVAAICQGTSTQYCATAGMSSYLWSNNATTQCITVSSAGTYSVTITNANGCSSSCSKTLAINELPACSISGPAAICTGTSAQYCATAGMSSYLWSNNATTQCITVSAAGTYSVTITNANGCSSSCSKTLSINELPACAISGPAAICQGTSAQYCATAGMSSYLWSNNATTQCITVSSAGTYSVTITNENGCSSSCSKTLALNELPACAISGPAAICQGTSAQYCATAGMSSYLWSNNATTQCITVSAAGTYSVTITNENGCSSSCSKTLAINELPACAISGPAAICQGTSAQYCATAGMSSYLWSNNATTQCITVSAAGTYSVTITNANGCSSACSKTLAVNELPACAISGPAAICQGTSAQYCATAGMSSYLWSNNATTQCITVSAAGTYSVTITNANGCSSSCSKTLAINELPACAISGPASICLGTSAQYCATAGMSSYLWSNNATTQCITVSAAGTYSVTITNANGCSSSCSKTLAINELPSCAISGPAAICQGTSAQYCATAGMSSYLWSNNATTQCITVSAAGTYSVTITNANGCSSSCSKTLAINELPACAISGPAAICQGTSAQYCATAGMSSYLWSNNATTQCITVSAAGTYSVTITNANGCSSACSKTLAINSLPACAISGPAAICQGTSAQYCATAGMSSYLWSNNATTQCITVSAAGTYSVTITNANGCSSSCSKTLAINELPACAISGPAAICQGTSAQYCATAGMSSYLWSNNATTQCITVSAAGTYSVAITNANGCSSSCSKILAINELPACSISGPAAICQGTSAQYCATAGMSSYLWSNNATTQCITVSAAGTYSVTITNANGCSSSCSKTLALNALPTCSISGVTSICQGASTQYCATAGMSSYLWSNNATTQCITVSSAGNYSVTITNANGCSSSCSKTLAINAPPSCMLQVPGTLPMAGSTNNSLCVTSNGATYQWSVSSADNSWHITGGGTASCVTYTAGTGGSTGTFNVTVTSAQGCTSTCTVSFEAMTAEYCTRTQGYYGSSKGKTCNGMTAVQNIAVALATPLTIGSGARTITFGTAEAACLNAKMPSGGTPAMLPIGNVNCAGATGSAYLNNGRFASVLWGQAIALNLNVRLNAALGTLQLSGPYMCTLNTTNCVNGLAVAGTQQVFSLPQVVLTYLGADKSVNHLLAVANLAMGGNLPVIAGVTTPTLSQIAGALGALNEGFDECRMLCGFSNTAPAMTASLHKDDVENDMTMDNGVAISSFPNPFTAATTVQFQLKESANVTVEVFSVTGARVATLYSGAADAGQVYSMVFDATNLAEGMYMCRLSTADNSFVHKLVLIK